VSADGDTGVPVARRDRRVPRGSWRCRASDPAARRSKEEIVKLSLRRGLLLLLAVASLPAWACNNGLSDTSANQVIYGPAPTAPTTTVTETFSGNLNTNGAASYSFSVLAGTVTATLTSLGDPSVTVGLGLGNWTGSACVIAIANDATTQGASVSGTANIAGTLCTRIYDVGNVVTTLPYTITVVHQ
jgi:hypothetical protein